MSERKIPIYLECGYSIAMQVLGGKWKICIIEALRDKPLRPSLIFKEVPDATERVINQQLKELLEYKIIDRKIYAEQPPRTEYFLTNLGRSAFPNATFVGFSGTPIDETIQVFGDVVDSYTMQQSVEDEITVELKYIPRIANVTLESEKVKEIDAYYKQCADEGATDDDVAASESAMSAMEVILGDEE